VIGGVQKAKQIGIVTGCVVCNPNSALASEVDFPIEAIVGPEFVTGSTRMKAGTAQKLVLNMLTTAVMIKLGRVKGNKMVDMQLSNLKLVDRGVRMIMESIPVTREVAEELLEKNGSVRKAVEAYKS
jgi:N-acetylmuramic acid 6-phosphate etherase